MKRSAIFLICGAITLSLTAASCGRKSSDSTPVVDSKNSKSYNIKLWKKYDVPPGADPSVPDSMGGAGFEKIAEKMGFQTYIVKDDEVKYFGDARAKVGGDIRIVSNQFPATFRPEGQNSNSVYNADVKGSVYETLLGTHPLTREWMPGLASHWKIGDDKMTFTFRIDPNARFSDGKPVTSEDVVATWKLLMDETILEPSSQLVYSKFEQPVAISKYLVQVKSKTLNFRNLLYFGAGMIVQPAHEIGNLTGKEYLEKYNMNMPAGSGEYILLQEDLKEGKRYILTRRDDYWAKDYTSGKYTGNFDRIVYEVVTDNPTIEYEKFKNGEADMFRFTMNSTEKWIKDTDYDAIKNGWVRRLRIFTDGPMGTAGYAFNMRKPPFDDRRVRKAFGYLLPRKQIIEKLLYNEYEPYDSHYPNTVYANPNNEKVEFNPELANRLLDEAGWSQRNAQGIRVKNGVPLSIEASITKPQERFVTPYQQELRKAGVDLKLKNEDWTSTIKNIDARNFTIFPFGYSGLVTPNPETSLSSKLADKSDNNNIQGVKNARIDVLLDEYDKTFDMKRQVEIIREIDGISDSIYYDALQWNPRGIRIAYWDKFGMPEYVLPRQAQLSYVYQTIALTWWYEPEKAAAITEAKKSNKDLGGNKNIQEILYWKNLK